MLKPVGIGIVNIYTVATTNVMIEIITIAYLKPGLWKELEIQSRKSVIL